ncbi:uncharacterized protein TRAVEDRAFT_64712 [Trametes versicolor FP-101664 SS1]|uniref:uncharacterized protein n=1 Tax=Trametes versicolor (strain FP-101664) TaxID=717944 RepID=UPI0004621CA9|nr:uncharacterized protein TRAVEDRAFT_64712 [Trametes versicolor FP-101664 SS1]EIW59947.1 hypothetical protein TRAVEDRAFT_64712 [Trametes versicolor FP-101664 SS1]
MSAVPVQVLSAIYQEDLLEMAAIALIAYEYIITFNQEVTLFWKRKPTGATALFFGTRYIGLLTYSFLGAATYAPMSDKVRESTQSARSFSGLRTLALSKMNYYLAFAVFIFALGPFVINLHTISLGLVGTNIAPFGCGGGADLTQALAIMGVVVSRSCAIIADIIAITVTWRSTVNVHGVLAGDRRSSVASTLFVNGTIYFLVFVTMNTFHLLLTLLSVVDALEPVSLVTVFTDPLATVLTCRFLLALQSANQQALGQGSAEDGEDDERGGSSTLQFASRIIGSIAASIPAGHGVGGFDGEEEESEGGDPEADDGRGCRALEGGRRAMLWNVEACASTRALMISELPVNYMSSSPF